MPRLSVWAIRASLLYLLAGFTIGAALLWSKGMPLDPRLWLLLPAHIEFLLMGWIVQMTVGVAYWILPRRAASPKRGNPTIAWGSVVLLNIGIVLIACSTLVGQAGGLVIFGRVLEFIALAAFVLNSWPRLRQVAG